MRRHLVLAALLATACPPDDRGGTGSSAGSTDRARSDEAAAAKAPDRPSAPGERPTGAGGADAGQGGAPGPAPATQAPRDAHGGATAPASPGAPGTVPMPDHPKDEPAR
jgi:hypothetical protein